MTLSRRWRIVLFGLAAGTLVALLGSLWLLRSTGGRDFFLARAIAVLPEGSVLRWQSLDGSLAGPLEIRGLHYAYKAHRFDAKRLRIDHGLWPLLSGRLDINSLTVEGATWVIPRDDSPTQLPRWPDVLPVLDMPLTVNVRALKVRGLQVMHGPDRLARISRIDGALLVGPGRLQMKQMVAISDRGALRIHGDYLPGDNFRSTLDGRVVFPAVSGAPPALLNFAARGDLDDFGFYATARAPAPIALTLAMRDGGSDRPRWKLDAVTTQWVPLQTGLADAAPIAMDLHLVGDGGRAKLRGSLSRDGIAIKLAPSNLILNEGIVAFSPLAIQLEQGAVALTGAVVLRGGDPYFNLRLGTRALRLTPVVASAETPPVTASGMLRVRGPWRAWRVNGEVGLHRANESAKVTVAGRGDARRLRVDSMLARTPGGTLRGTGELQWQPNLRVVLDAALAGFDPGYLFPDYPGAVSGRIAGRAQRDAAGNWQGDAKASDLRGTLRNRPLQGEAELRFADASASGNIDLRIGDSHLLAIGTVGERIDVTARFAPFDLHDLWPAARGRLRGTVVVRGARAAPSYIADLQGNALDWAPFKAATLSAKGSLPATGNGGDLRLSATALEVSGTAFDRATFNLAGSVAALRAKGNLSGKSGQFSAQGTANQDGGQWRGRLLQLRLAPPRIAAWNLQSPVAWRYGEGTLDLERACLASTGDGRVCAQANASRISVQGTKLPWALAQPWLADTSLDLAPFGTVDFNGDFVSNKAGTWSGGLTATSASGGLRLDPESKQTVLAFSNLRADARVLASQISVTLQAGLEKGGSITGNLRVSGMSGSAPMQGNLRFDMRELQWIELFSVDVAGPTGQLTGNLSFAGTMASPSIGGEARLSRFAAELPAQGVMLSAGEFTLRGEPGGQARIEGSVQSGKGRLRVDGSLNLRDDNSPVDLHLSGTNITVADTPELEATMSPDLRLRRSQGIWQVRGTVGVPMARIDLERLDKSVSVSPDVVVLDPRVPNAASALFFDTDVMLQLGDDVKLRGFGLDGGLTGSLRVRDQSDRVAQVTGTLDVSGTYVAYGRALQIKRGRLGFINAAFDDPTLDILAERDFEEVTVGVRVRGSAMAPETTVTSSPAMATSEALSWLMIGRPLSTASGSQLQQINAGSLALSAGSNLLAQRLGTRLGLDAAGIGATRALGESTFTVGKQISPRLLVSYGVSLLGTGQVLTLKYLLRRGLDVSLESGSVETAGSLNWRKEK